MDKFRLFNFRPMVVTLVSFCVGIIICNYLFTNVAWAVGIFVVYIAVLIVYSIRLKNIVLSLKSLILMLLGLLLLLLSILPYLNLKDYSNVINITGEIVKFNEGKDAYLVIKDAEIDGENIDGAISVWYSGDYSIPEDALGYKVKLYVDEIYPIGLVDDDRKDILNSYQLDMRIKYFAESSKIVVLGNYEHVSIRVRNLFKLRMKGNLSEDNTTLVYSALFGDKTNLTEETYVAYRLSGMAHVLAVSGLHVGLIVSALMFLLKLFRLKKSYRSFLVIVLLIFYCYLCGWTPSVLRATVMISVHLISSLVFREYDRLSATAFSAFIILLFKPYLLFHVSFLLSFGCVIGIDLFFDPAKKLLNKLKIRNKFTESLALSIIVNICIMLITLYYFGEINLMSTVSNILILPLFSALFSLSFVVLLVSLFIPIVAKVLIGFNPIFKILDIVVKFFASINKLFKGINIEFLTLILVIVLLVFNSKYFLKKSFTRYSFAFVILVAIIMNIVYLNRGILF